MFVEEMFLKLQYRVIGHRLAMLKVRKKIAREQAALGREVDQQGSQKVTEIMNQIDHIVFAIDTADLKVPADRQYMEAQKHQLLTHKIKLQEYEQGRREGQDRLQDDRRMFEDYKTREMAKIRKKGDDLLKFSRELSNIATKLESEQRRTTTSAAMAPTSATDGVVMLEDDDSDVEP
jgi:hypothetical protein